MITPNTDALNSTDKAVALGELAKLMYEMAQAHDVPYISAYYFEKYLNDKGKSINSHASITYNQQGDDTYYNAPIYPENWYKDE